MASMGMLGAAGGAAGGFGKAMLMEIETARQERLATLKSTQARETNKQNNDQRHENAMTQLDKGQEYSLAELTARGEADKEQVSHAQSVKDASASSYTDEYDDNGQLTGQRDSKTNEWKSAGKNANTTRIKSPDKLVIADSLKAMGVDNEKLVNFIMGDSSEEEVQRKLMMEMAGNSSVMPEDIPARVNEMMGMLYPPDAPGPGGSQQGGGERQSKLKQIMDANPGKDEAWAEGYLKHLGM